MLEILERLEREPSDTLREIYQRVDDGLIDPKTPEGKGTCLGVVNYLREKRRLSCLGEFYQHLALKNKSSKILEEIVINLGSFALLMGFAGKEIKEFREDVRRYFDRRRVDSLKEHLGVN